MQRANSKDNFYTDNTLSMTIKFPKELLDRIVKIKEARIIAKRNPHLLVIWIGYYDYFLQIIKMYEAYNILTKENIPVKFLGLTLEWTDIPDTVEIY